MKTAERLIIHTDGGARGNPGPAAIGVVIEGPVAGGKKTYGKTIGRKTNNEAEYEAVLFALAKAKSLVGGARAKTLSIDVYLDSELVARQLSGEYKIEEERLFPLFIRIWNLRMDFLSVAFHHIPREKNLDADRLVNEALDTEQTSLFS